MEAGDPAQQGDVPGLVINGEAVRADVPPRIVDGRLLVPLRVISEYLGAAVAWQPKGQKVTLRSEDMVVEVAVGSHRALVNGEETRLDVPPVIVKDRTLVPLRFVAEAFAAQVSWDAPSRTAAVVRPHRLLGVSFAQGPDGGSLLIATGGSVRPNFHGAAGENGTRMVVDLPYVVVPPDGVVMVGTGPVRLVRAAGIAGNPPAARVVIDLAEGAEGVLREAAPAGKVLVDVREAPQAGAAAPVPVARPEQPAAGRLAGRVIALDPGHGGVDPGAPGPGDLEEKDIDLAIARQVRVLLAEAGARVVLTRDGDETVGLYERADLADRAGTDLFVSIHANASPYQATAGIETYYYPGSSEGRRLATILQRTLVTRLGRPDRGVQAADFVVIRESAAPAALVECGYLTNRQEAQLLAAEEFRLKIARAIADGIIRYLTPGETG